MKKQIAVADRAEASVIIGKLTEKYGLVASDDENLLDASNDHLHVFYDADAQTVVIESVDNETFGEYLRELAAEFPTFF